MTSSTVPRGAAARDRLLVAAGEELVATGELEVAAVARRARVSAGLPYRYFGTRSGLLTAVVERFYDKLGRACALRDYEAPTWAEREQQRIRDWVTFLYTEPLAPVVLGGLTGDGEVATAHTRLLHELTGLGAHNIARAQQGGELPGDRDPQMLAAATLGGLHAVAAVAFARDPRPPAEVVIDQVWAFIAGAVGLRP
ncbi:TetR/AcrR family transcriptional regulator [Actinoplanes sp. ATCC 53533]|uniref:TetR/AcrR family transcriptional regulator n=1 Tax=Actinoplanes sp. ATCC 53533 TaxID=1288362 RepID=UPI000F7A4AA4|nr:TetR/AcrR family transcriptional regulator [Actinoplanes sp. ATCC 53533]RSM50468.1 TetR/AcrR family transcriptional regulator [Actinoplanes sp. ATCC 53533]